MNDFTLDDVLALAHITAAGLAASGVNGPAAAIAVGSILALIETAKRLATGEKPTALPSYEDGLKAYLANGGKLPS